MIAISSPCRFGLRTLIRTALLLLSIPSTVRGLSLANFQEISGASLVCSTAYGANLNGCQASDFTNNAACSTSCISALEAVSTLVCEACAGVKADQDSLIATFLNGNGVQALCPNVVTKKAGTSTITTAATTSAVTVKTTTPLSIGSSTMVASSLPRGSSSLIFDTSSQIRPLTGTSSVKDCSASKVTVTVTSTSVKSETTISSDTFLFSSSSSIARLTTGQAKSDSSSFVASSTSEFTPASSFSSAYSTSSFLGQTTGGISTGLVLTSSSSARVSTKIKSTAPSTVTAEATRAASTSDLSPPSPSISLSSSSQSSTAPLSSSSSSASHSTVQYPLTTGGGGDPFEIYVGAGSTLTSCNGCLWVLSAVLFLLGFFLF